MLGRTGKGTDPRVPHLLPTSAPDLSCRQGGHRVAQAVNSSEQFVYDICRKSFLSLWTYVNPQGKTSGKELCDALVVCDPHVVVISVKQVELKKSNNTSVNLDRWERKAVAASIKQI